MAIDIVLSTRNPSKAHQIKALFKGLDLYMLTLEDAGIEGEAVEDGSTLEENAEKKARFAWKSGVWSMADDTGLYIDALGGRPGIHAARWAGDDKTTDEIRDYTLAQLSDVPEGVRGATFRTVAVVVSPEGERSAFVGEAPGSILRVARVPNQPKMPYSAIFVPQGDTRSWAEMSVEEENAISHRGRAFAQVRAFFEDILAKRS